VRKQILGNNSRLFILASKQAFSKTLKPNIMSSEMITTIANIALALSVVVAVIFGIAQIQTAKKDRRISLTMGTLQQFQTREFAEILLFMTTTKLPASYEEWKKHSNADRATFIQVSQQLESLGLLVAEGLISIDLIDKTLGSFVSGTWAKSKSYILDMREQMEDPFLAEYFQWLAERIEERMTSNPRLPFFQTNQKAC